MEYLINYFKSIKVNDCKIQLDKATLISDPVKCVNSHLEIIQANKDRQDYIKPYLNRLQQIHDYIEMHRKICRIAEQDYAGQIKCERCNGNDFYVRRNNIHYQFMCNKCNKHITNKHLNHTGSGHPAIIMSKRYTGSICLTDIPKEKITTGKNGKKYLNVTLWLNDTEDQYKNIGSIQIQQSKEERESGGKGLYIGNFKEPAAAPVENKANEPVLADDLPF